MSEQVFDRFGLGDFFPGSNQRRDAPNAIVVARLNDVETKWDSHPRIVGVRGKKVEMFTVGDFGKALGGKTTYTIRMWEKEGYIPQAPFRLPSRVTADGKEVKNRRLYARANIEDAIAEFTSRGILNARRINWDANRDLALVLMRKWKDYERTLTNDYTK